VEPTAWDVAAAAWTDHVREGGDVPWESHARALADLLPPPAGLVVDVGCGEGRLVRELCARGYNAIGFDVTEGLIDAARTADPGGSYEVADARSLPLRDRVARLVTCINVLQHLPDLDTALSEIARVLTVEGVLIAAVVHPVAEAGAYDAERDELAVTRYFDECARFVSLGKIGIPHHHRTIESYVRAPVGHGFALDELREVPGRSGSVPLYLDLRAHRTDQDIREHS
jgi:ubiquinone/menaquinone biosynthesis C-methylase UbiE